MGIYNPQLNLQTYLTPFLAQLIESADYLAESITIMRVIDLEKEAFQLVYANEHILKQMNVTGEELLEKSPKELMAEDDYEFFLKQNTAAITSKKPVHFERTVTTPEGSQVLKISAIPLVNADGSCHAFLSISKDVTDYVRTQQDLESKVRELEKAVKLMSGRELEMKKLKDELKELKGD